MSTVSPEQSDDYIRQIAKILEETQVCGEILLKRHCHLDTDIELELNKIGIYVKRTHTGRVFAIVVVN